MRRKVTFTTQSWPIRGRFAIARGSRTEVIVIVCKIEEGDAPDQIAIGRGECVPYARYSETPQSVLAQLNMVADEIANGADRSKVAMLLSAGAARNAIDCALWDLEAKLSGNNVAGLICSKPPVALETAYTISLDTPEKMALATREAAHRPILKIKVGGDDDAARIHAVSISAPDSRIILDANEGWRIDNITENLEAAARAGIALIEQPLPAGDDAMLKNLPHHVPICADESAHTSDDLENLDGLYDVINIKLDKTGGLSEALVMRDRAKSMGFGVMAGCMVATSLSMAPAVLLAQNVDFVDLDGPLLLAKDVDNGLRYEDAMVNPPEPALWG